MSQSPPPPPGGDAYQQHEGQQQPYGGQQQPYGGAQQPYPPYGGQQQYQYAQPRPNNSMALVSLIAGIAGLTLVPFIGSVVAVITGHMARKEIARTGEEGSGLATAGLVTGWIGVGLGALALIATLLFFGIFAAAVGSSGY